MSGELKCQPGFGNHFVSEAMAGVLVDGQNSPQHVPHGLYAELLSGTAFTAPGLRTGARGCIEFVPRLRTIGRFSRSTTGC